MSCESFRPAALAGRRARAFVVRDAAGEGRLESLDGEPVDDLHIKVRLGTERGEPYTTCVAASEGVGARVVDAWADDERTYMVTGYYPLGTLIDYATRLRRESAAPALYDELDLALVALFGRLRQSTLCHLDLHSDNVMLYRRDGALEAQPIDWEFADTGGQCATSSFDSMLSSFPTGLLEKLPNARTLFSQGAMGQRRPEKKQAALRRRNGVGVDLRARFETA